MQLPKNNKTIAIVSTTIILWFFAFSLIAPAISERQDKTSGIKESNGRDTAIEVYWDEKGVNRVSSVDWGRIDPGGNTTLTLYVKNRGKNPVILSYYTADWSPNEAADYLKLTWDYAGQEIKFKEIVQITFTLSVSESIEQIELFSFDTYIVAS